MRRRTLFLLALAGALFATQTRTWRQGDASDYERAVLKNSTGLSNNADIMMHR